MSDAPVWSRLSPAEARRIDQICDRFEAAWKAGPRPMPEEYLSAAGEPRAVGAAAPAAARGLGFSPPRGIGRPAAITSRASPPTTP